MKVTSTTQSEQQTETYNKRLKKLYELSMTLSGDPVDVFERIPLMIGELLEVRVVCLSEIRGDELYFISVCIDGKITTDVGKCPLSITPCATVTQTKDIRVYDYVAERFPEASFLKTHNAFSYCGFPSLDNNGDVIAVTCLLDDKPHEFSQQDQELLQIFGQRIAIEMERERDLKERKRVEDKLKESEERYRLVVENQTDMIVRFDLEGKLLFASPSYCNTFGKTAEELIGKKFMPLIHKEDRKKVADAIKKVYKPPYNVSIEERAMTKDGWQWQEWVNTAILNEKNEIVSIVAAGRNINERKRMEEEILRSHKLESIGILAGGIAHDFNNLLTGIMNHIYLSRMHTAKESKAYQHLESAEKALVKSADLTQQLLTFSKGGAPVKKAVSIIDIVQETAEFVLRGSNIKCEYKISGTIRPVHVDKDQISQVIQNIVINAAQAMPGGGTILIRMENAVFGSGTGMPLKDGNFVKITIRDNGSGIPEDQLQRIFDPYFTTKEMGHGLGLTIAFSVIKSHGGHISIESESGHGTTFDIYLPATDSEISAEQTLDSEDQTGEGRVLIMDDEEFIRSSLGEILVHMGYDVESARDGAEAVEMYQQAMKSSNPFDAVILDLTVPGGMGGEEAIKALRGLDPTVKAIVSSGYSDDSVIANFREYGFRGILTKPYKNSVELNKILQSVITDLQE